MSGDGENDDAVGYGRPPKAHRFQKGRSGNPSGRPKAQKTSLELFRKELSARLSVQDQGRSRKLTKAELIVKQYVNRAVKGDAAALRMMSPLFTALDADQHRRGEAQMPDKERRQVDEALIAAVAALAVAPDAED